MFLVHFYFSISGIKDMGVYCIWVPHWNSIWYREPETQRNARSFGSRIALAAQTPGRVAVNKHTVLAVPYSNAIVLLPGKISLVLGVFSYISQSYFIKIMLQITFNMHLEETEMILYYIVRVNKILEKLSKTRYKIRALFSGASQQDREKRRDFKIQ